MDAIVVSAGDYLEWQRRSQDFSIPGSSATAAPLIWPLPDRPEQVEGIYVNAGIFEIC